MLSQKVVNTTTLNRDLPSQKILLHAFEIDSILIKLMEDKYIFRFDGNYALTVAGRMFIEQGGYKQQLENEKRKAIKEVVYIYAVGIGTALAGLYGLFEMSRWVYHHFHFLQALKFWN
jgi:hypothetical protein